MKQPQVNKKRWIKYAVFALLILLLSGAGFYIINLQNRLEGAQTIAAALSNDITRHIDKNGAETAEKEMILSSYKDLKAIHASDSSEIGRLKKLITKKTISATIITNETKGLVTGKTHSEFTHTDTTGNSLPCDTAFAVYTSTISNEWVDIKTNANRDSTHVDFKFVNKYEITQSFEKKGKWPFRHETPVVKVKNENPYTTTTGLSSFAINPPKTGKKILLAGTTGVIVGILIRSFIGK